MPGAGGCEAAFAYGLGCARDRQWSSTRRGGRARVGPRPERRWRSNRRSPGEEFTPYPRPVVASSRRASASVCLGSRKPVAGPECYGWKVESSAIESCCGLQVLQAAAGREPGLNDRPDSRGLGRCSQVRLPARPRAVQGAPRGKEDVLIPSGNDHADHIRGRRWGDGDPDHLDRVVAAPEKPKFLGNSVARAASPGAECRCVLSDRVK